MRALVLLALLPAAALAEPFESVMTNPKGAVLQIYGVTDQGFDFTLSDRWPCAEGEVDCLVVAGHAEATAKGYTYADPNHDRSRIFFADTAEGVKVLQTAGDLGSGTANRAAKLAFPGDYAPDEAAAAAAGDPGDGDAPAETRAFRSPSGNIGCLFVLGDATSVRCDMADLVPSFTEHPQDCDFDWGSSFGITDGKAEVLCVSDTVMDPGAEVLDYGATLTEGDISCRSEKTGLTCQTPEGHGFTLSRKRQSLF